MWIGNYPPSFRVFREKGFFLGFSLWIIMFCCCQIIHFSGLELRKNIRVNTLWWGCTFLTFFFVRLYINSIHYDRYACTGELLYGSRASMKYPRGSWLECNLSFLEIRVGASTCNLCSSNARLLCCESDVSIFVGISSWLRNCPVWFDHG